MPMVASAWRGPGLRQLQAYLASDRATSTSSGASETELLLRDDSLVAWKWNPKAEPRTDANNASDGDILIAYALGLAADAWAMRYQKAGVAIATAIGRRLTPRGPRPRVLLSRRDRLRPAAGRVRSQPSYWIFEAIPVLKRLAPDFDWDGLTAAGIDLVGAARFGKSRLPTDWVAIEAKGLAPAPGFPPVFGYNAIRIPLYLVRGGAVGGPLLEPFRQMAAAEGVPLVDVSTDAVVERLTDPGYRLVGAIVAPPAHRSDELGSSGRRVLSVDPAAPRSRLACGKAAMSLRTAAGLIALAGFAADPPARRHRPAVRRVAGDGHSVPPRPSPRAAAACRSTASPARRCLPPPTAPPRPRTARRLPPQTARRLPAPMPRRRHRRPPPSRSTSRRSASSRETATPDASMPRSPG